jgi:hypothetical protein
MSNTPLEQAFAVCQANKTAWQNKKDELAAAETALDEHLAPGAPRNAEKIRYLSEYIDIKQWEITCAAGCYIRSHEAVQHISICNALGAFMSQNGAALVSTLAPELMGINQRRASVSELAIRRATHYLGEALRDYLATGPEINYTAENSGMLTAIGFRPDKAALEDNQQKYTPAQNHVYAHRQAELIQQQPE